MRTDEEIKAVWENARKEGKTNNSGLTGEEFLRLFEIKTNERRLKNNGI